jgi:hypothetical protein
MRQKDFELKSAVVMERGGIVTYYYFSTRLMYKF